MLRLEGAKCIDSTKIKEYIMRILLVSYILYRIYILIKYAFRYVEEDQAIMWYAAQEFAHLKFREPKFYGQNYGTMFEALVAAPLVRCGIPLNISLPTASSFINLFGIILTFNFIHKYESKYRRYVLQFIFLIFIACINFRYDVITSIPRALAPGLTIALIAGILLTEGTSLFTRFAGGFLAVIGCLFSANALTIVLVFVAYVILCNSYSIKHIISFLAGAVTGGVIAFSSTAFYANNPMYNLHPSWPIQVSWDVLYNNLKNVSDVLSDFAGGVEILLAFVFLAICIIGRKYKLGLIIGMTYAGCMLSLGLTKLNDYMGGGSILFSRSRMLLYIPVLIMILLYFLAREDAIGQVKKNKRLAEKIKIHCIYYVAVILFIVLMCWKVHDFSAEVKNPDSTLYHDQLLCVKNVETINKFCVEIYDKYQEENADFLVIIGPRVLGYSVSALLYEDVLEYNAEYERRTWLYFIAKEVNRFDKILLVQEQNDELVFQTVELNGQSVTAYLKDALGLYRFPAGSIYADAY